MYPIYVVEVTGDFEANEPYPGKKRYKIKKGQKLIMVQHNEGATEFGDCETGSEIIEVANGSPATKLMKMIIGYWADKNGWHDRITGTTRKVEATWLK